jgi:hypothetical protein
LPRPKSAGIGYILVGRRPGPATPSIHHSSARRTRVPRAALLRYDDLAARPEPVLTSALSRVGLPAELGFLGSGRLDPTPNHTVAGNPLRFERGAITIRPDVEWRAGLAPGALRLVTALTWPLLLRYGFPLRPRA